MMFGIVRHWWRNIQWLQRFKEWRYTKVPIVFGFWSMWARGGIVLHRVYWRGKWTPFVRAHPRYPNPPTNTRYKSTERYKTGQTGEQS
jgi:hypothetical protein